MEPEDVPPGLLRSWLCFLILSLRPKKSSRKFAKTQKKNPEFYNKNIFIVKLSTDKIMKKIENPEEKYEKQEYYDHPERFKSIFQDEYLPYLSLFVNGIYWDHRYPRLIQKKELTEYYK